MMTFRFIQLIILCHCMYTILAGLHNSSNNNHSNSWNPLSQFRNQRNNNHNDPTTTTTTKKKKKGSLFQIDPKFIIQQVCKYGGIVLPELVKTDLKVLEKTCDCDETSIDLINRKLEVLNFTLDLPEDDNRNKNKNDRPALRIGRITIKWDSYIKPCLDIEVEDVDILVEFVNVFLTRNNWYVYIIRIMIYPWYYSIITHTSIHSFFFTNRNELQDAGFPPTFYTYTTTAAATTESSSSTNSNSFVTIGSIDLSGKAILKLYSRTLDKELVDDIQLLNLENLNKLNQRIQNESQKALERYGRRGCSTGDLYNIIETYFNQLLRRILTQAATDITLGALTNNNIGTGLDSINKDVKNVLSSSKEMILRYAKNVGDKTNNDIERKFTEFGVRPEHIDIAKRFARNVLKQDEEENDV